MPVVSFLSVGVVVCAVDGVVVAAVDGVIVAAAVDGVVAAAVDGVVAAAVDGVSSSSVLRRFERDVHCERGNQRSRISSKNYNYYGLYTNSSNNKSPTCQNWPKKAIFSTPLIDLSTLFRDMFPIGDKFNPFL